MWQQLQVTGVLGALVSLGINAMPHGSGTTSGGSRPTPTPQAQGQAPSRPTSSKYDYVKGAFRLTALLSRASP